MSNSHSIKEIYRGKGEKVQSKGREHQNRTNSAPLTQPCCCFVPAAIRSREVVAIASRMRGMWVARSRDQKLDALGSGIGTNSSAFGSTSTTLGEPARSPWAQNSSSKTISDTQDFAVFIHKQQCSRNRITPRTLQTAYTHRSIYASQTPGYDSSCESSPRIAHTVRGYISILVLSFSLCP